MMRHSEIIDRLNDLATHLERDKDIRAAVIFLRATAQRIKDDDELEAELELVRMNHSLRKGTWEGSR
jgi:hypothetical protein